MGWSGGTYTKGNNATGGWAGDASLGIGIEAGRHDTQDDDFTAGINNCIAKDGQNTPTANLPMGGYKHTGVASASANDEYTSQGQLTDGSFFATLKQLVVEATTANEALKVVAKSGATGALAQLQNNATDPIFRVDNDGAIYVNSTTGSAGSNTALEVRAKNHTDSGQCFVSTFSELADTEEVAFIATGKKSGGNNRQAALGVYKHSTILETSAYLFLNSTGGLDTYTWYDNSGILRIGTTANLIGTTGGQVIGTQTSDERLKEIDPAGVTYGLNTVKQLQPIAYIRKDDPDQTKRLGFGAQTTKTIVPEAVYDTKEKLEGEDPAETKLAMDYTTLIPVLVKAIQELEAKVASLEAQLA